MVDPRAHLALYDERWHLAVIVAITRALTRRDRANLFYAKALAPRAVSCTNRRPPVSNAVST